MGKSLNQNFKFGQKSTITLNPSIQEDEKRINILKDKGFRGRENDEKDQYRNSDLIKASEFNYLFTNIRDEFENIYQNLQTIYDNVSIADGSEKLTLGINDSGLVSLCFINTFTSFWNILPVMNGWEDYLGFTWSSESNISNEKLIRNEDGKYWKFIFTKDGELYSNGKNENRRFILKYELDNVEKKLVKIGKNGSQQITEIWKKINNEIDKSIENIKKEVKENTTKSKENKKNISDNKDKISNNDSRIEELNTRTNNLELTRRSHEEKMKYFENKFSMTTFEQFLIEKWKFITNHSWVSVENIDWNYLYNQLNTPGIYRDQNNSRNILLVYKTSWEMYWKDRYYSSDDYIIGKDILNYNIMIVLSKLPMINKLLGISNNRILRTLYYKGNENQTLTDIYQTLDDNKIDSANFIYFYLEKEDIYFIGSSYRCYIYDNKWRRLEDYNMDTSHSRDVITIYRGNLDLVLMNKYKDSVFGRIYLLLKYGYYVKTWAGLSPDNTGNSTIRSYPHGNTEGSRHDFPEPPVHRKPGTPGRGTIRSVSDSPDWIKYIKIKNKEDRIKFLKEREDEISSY